MGAEVELHKLVDLALRTPDVGVVNFNHLHTLLHAILNHIGLMYDPQSGVLKPQNIDYGEEKSKMAISAEQSEGSAKREQEERRDSNGKKKLSAVSEQHSSLNGVNVASLQARHENLEEKVRELEGRLKVLDELPSTKMIIEQAQQTGNSMLDSATNQNTLSGIWQFMKINSRLQTLEAAIDRVMSVLNEFLGSGGKTIKELRREVADLVGDLKTLKEHSLVSNGNTSSSLCENHNCFQNLKDTFVTKDDLLCFVQWPALEEALNVKKGDLNKRCGDSGSKEKTAYVDNRQTLDAESDGRPYTAPVSLTSQILVEIPEVPKTAFVGSHKVYGDILERPCISHPSEEMVDCLRQIGELSEKHNSVVKNVVSLAESQQEIVGELARIEEALPQKVTKEELHIPDDLQDQLGMLKQGLEFLNTNQDLVAIAEIKEMALDNKDQIEAIKRETAMLARLNKSGFHGFSASAPTFVMDGGALEAIRGHLDELQTEKEQFVKETESTQAEIMENLNRKQDHIEALYTYVEKLQESKADKENVALEMNIKADKTALESKVNVSTFDSTFNMLDEGIREALQKMDDYMNEEIALKHALNQLSVDLSGKMDGQAFQALKNYLEQRIADVQKSRNLIAAETKVDLSDAAGFRKSITFNCISCSRPVELPIKESSVPNMPVPRGVRTKRSKGPYLSYERDQIRQYQRGYYSDRKAEKTLKEIVSGRPCGGSHTVIYHPKRRTTKITQLNQVLARDDGQEIPNWGRELSVVEFLKGSDGLVYKGRFKQTIPPITKNFQYEHELSPLTKEDLRSMPSQSHSELSSPLEAHGQVSEEPEKENYMYRKSSQREVHQVNGHARTTSPRTRMRHIVKRHSSDSPPVPLPSPSPPTVRETESRQALVKEQKQDALKQEGKLKPFFPASPRPAPEETGKNKAAEPYSN